jgi:hypothetical protein
MLFEDSVVPIKLLKETFFYHILALSLDMYVSHFKSTVWRREEQTMHLKNIVTDNMITVWFQLASLD